MTRVGILGAGQLGRMMALAGYPLALEFAFYDTSGAPTANIGKVYSDPQNKQKELALFLESVDIVTYEFEHLPLDLAKNIAACKPVFPGTNALAICQNRQLEKQLFQQLNIPVAEYKIVSSSLELQEAVNVLGLPVVAKSLTQGYDGKGQTVIRNFSQCTVAWQQINHPKLIVERFVKFSRELSLVAARNQKGETVMYPLVENNHQQGILRYTIAPAPSVSASTQHQAEIYLSKLMDHMNYIGVLTIELFETKDGLLANEMAPRVHNSGHWSMDGAHTGQFENHLRAILGLPLGETTPHGVSAMINLIGKHANLPGVLGLRDTHLHHYGKAERKDRKVGHININATNYTELTVKLLACLDHVPQHLPLDCSLINRGSAE
jgi:5-(carboxyamino)imidazole ribonucleotide synthase